MKKTILFTVLLAGVCAKSQTHRFIYDVAYKKDSTSSILTKENFHLDISEGSTSYYQRDFFVADSLIKNNLPFPKDAKLNTSTLVQHKTGDDSYNEYDLMEQVVLKLQTKDPQNWKLTNESKKVKGYTLQKATLTYGGRNWIAWFSKDIPFQEGPYKFHGLPGMIVELYDDRNDYKFEMVKSVTLEKEPKNQFLDMMQQMGVPVNRDKYQATKLAYYESPINYIKNTTRNSNNDQFFLNDGTKVNPGNMREINERLKQTIRKYNNPIELDKAIIYR